MVADGEGMAGSRAPLSSDERARREYHKNVYDMECIRASGAYSLGMGATFEQEQARQAILKEKVPEITYDPVWSRWSVSWEG